MELFMFLYENENDNITILADNIDEAKNLEKDFRKAYGMKEISTDKIQCLGSPVLSELPPGSALY